MDLAIHVLGKFVGDMLVLGAAEAHYYYPLELFVSINLAFLNKFSTYWVTLGRVFMPDEMHIWAGASMWVFC